jgi:hypothetical protein
MVTSIIMQNEKLYTLFSDKQSILFESGEYKANKQRILFESGEYKANKTHAGFIVTCGDEKRTFHERKDPEFKYSQIREKWIVTAICKDGVWERNLAKPVYLVE